MSWEFDRVSLAETLEIPTGGFISDSDKVYPQSCLMCSSCFSAGFFPGVSPPRITSRWRVSPLYGIAHVKTTPKQMKISVWFNTSNNSWKCKCLKHTNVRICSHADPRSITNIIMLCLLPVFRCCCWSWEWYVFNHKYLKNDRGGDRGRPFLLKV